MKPSRLALVSGAAQGLGRAIAERLARDGCSLVVADVDEEGAMRTAEALCADGHEAVAISLDAGDEAAVARAYADIDSRFGRLDVLVNASTAGSEPAPVESITLDAWEHVIHSRLTSVFLMSRGAIPLMRRGGWGRIVNLSSPSARGRPGPGHSSCVAADAGIVSLSRVLAEDLGRDGITVNCVAPSPLGSGRTSPARKEADVGPVLARLAGADDVTAGVSWLCSERAGFFTGIVLDINGGTVMR